MNFNILTFPYEPIGYGLRQLSLSGAIGNIIAIIIYAVLSLIPMIILLYFYKRKTFCKLDAILPVISLLLFGLFYYMINPGLIDMPLPNTGVPILCSIFDSILVAYLVLRVIYKCQQADTAQLKKWIRLLLWGLILIFIAAIVAEIFHFTTEWSTSLVNIITYSADILITFYGIRLLDAMLLDSYSKDVIQNAEHLGRMCGIGLSIVTLSSMVVNLYQYVFRHSLLNIHVNVDMPLFSIVLMLCVFLLSRLIRENHKLKSDNDLFI